MFKRGDLVRPKDQSFLPWTGIVLQRDKDVVTHQMFVQVRRTEPTTLGEWVVWELEKDVCKVEDDNV